MKLIISIIHDEDVSSLLENLIKHGYKATKLSSTGGFLRRGNTTLLIGTEEEKVKAAVGIVKDVCRRGKSIIMNTVFSQSGAIMPESAMEIEVGGATLFIVDVENFIKI